DPMSLIHACDVLAAMGLAEQIERGPGRHGLSNAFFLYLRDPDGHRIELYNGDYLTSDPDFKPIRWDVNDPTRQTFCGHEAPDRMSLIHACDVLAAMGMAEQIERRPGRHGLSNAFFFYLRDPDGHRIELYNGDYLTSDPDFKPIRWDVNDPTRQTFWGHEAPDRWFAEATPVRDIVTGKQVEQTPATLSQHKPEFTL